MYKTNPYCILVFQRLDKKKEYSFPSSYAFILRSYGFALLSSTTAKGYSEAMNR